MKARIKKTGEIVNIAEYATIELEMCDSYGDPVCLAPEDIELIQERAAIAAMQGILCTPIVDGIDPNPSKEHIAELAVAQANALIEELKIK